jgi:DNA-3-methyladenine glycosylase II
MGRGRERGGCLPPRAPPSGICGKMKGIGVRILETEGDLAAGAARLVALEPRFGPVVAAGPLPLRRRADGFAALLSAIVAQQVSTASAAAIWGRVAAAGLDREGGLGRGGGRDADRLRAQPPQAALRAGAGGGGDRLGRAEGRGNGRGGGDAHGVPGVGRWTAEIYAKFALGHADVFAAGDLALQEARGGCSICPTGRTSGLARHGGGLGAGARGCRPGALGLLPVGHRPGGRLVSRVLEYGRKAPACGEREAPGDLPPRLWRGWQRPAGPRRSAGAAHARHGLRGARTRRSARR